jgi:tetratricopeptide (TPR) repeat protein
VLPEKNFRDDFVNGYVLEPVGRRQRTFAQWSLENTVDIGFTKNTEQLKELGGEIRGVLNTGLERLLESQLDSSSLLIKEIEFQSGCIVEAIEHGSTSVVSAIQHACDYLGGEFCEVRWAIDRQTEVAKKLLEVMLTSLDNTSRQYYQQGVACFEKGELEIAEERFIKALEENKTNHFAYQYLGFIAVQKSDGKAAIRFFDLARKFAVNDYHRAQALGHLARSLAAAGDTSGAIENLTAAIKATPNHAPFWYLCMIYHARLGNTIDAVHSLKQAIVLDWNYWSLSAVDSNTETIRKEVINLLEQIRREQQRAAHETLENFKHTIIYFRQSSIAGEVAPYSDILEACQRDYQRGTVFNFRESAKTARAAHTEALEVATRLIDKLIATNRESLRLFLKLQNDKFAFAKSDVEELKRAARFTATSYKGSFSIVQGLGVYVMVCLGFGFFNVEHPIKIFGAIVLVGAVFLAFLHPVKRYFNATLPAAELLARAEKKERSLPQLSAESEGEFQRERSRLDHEMQELNIQREYCQQRP